MMYKTEEDLVKSITKIIKAGKINGCLFFNRDSRKIFTELNLGYGIPDIVITHYKSIESNRTDYLNIVDISILRTINNLKQVSLEDIHNVSRTSKPQIKISLQKLLSQELVASENDLYKPDKLYKSYITETVAIEAKLRSWKQALKQAYRYKWFSERSFVFLPEETIEPAKKNLELFQEFEVGLASVNKKDGITVWYNPRMVTPISEDMYALLNEHLLSVAV